MKYRTRLAALLKAKGLTRLDVIRNTTVPYATIVSWEKDELDSLDSKYLQSVLKILHCTYEELVYPTSDPDDELAPEDELYGLPMRLSSIRSAL
jgi:transcriptional regulator with XRE-family HTH domain